jgi:hypothetical protein
MLTFRHSGSAGDVIYSIPAILSQGGGRLLLKPNVPAHYYPGAVHPSGHYRLSESIAKFLVSIFETQPGITAEIDKADTEIDWDLDEFRRSGINFQSGHIPAYYFYVIPGFYDLSSAWLFYPKQEHQAIVVNKTSRYSNTNITYKFLNDLDQLIVFVGLQDEYDSFLKDVPKAAYYKTPSGIHLLQAIAGAKVFVGNQSLAFAVAEGLKVPRVLETCLFANNVIPTGGICYSAINQKGFEFAVHDALMRANGV